MRLSGIRKLPGTAALAACVTLAVACSSGGSAPSVVDTTGPASAAGPSAVAPSPSPVPKLSVAQLKQRAAADSASMMAQFTPPPGAKKLTRAPAEAAALLAHPAFATGSFDSVDKVSWWLAPGSPPGLLAWEEGHMPSQFQINSFAPPSTGPVVSDTYFLKPQTGVLSSRDLVIALASAGRGKVAIRVDAEADWQPPRPAAEKFPSTAKVLTIAEVAAPGAKVKPAKLPSVTITDPAEIAHVAALLNGLLAFPPGIFACPPGPGHDLILTFRASAGGAVLATAFNSGPCGSIKVTLAGKPRLALADPGPFTPEGNYTAQVFGLTGLSWKL